MKTHFVGSRLGELAEQLSSVLVCKMTILQFWCTKAHFLRSSALALENIFHALSYTKNTFYVIW